MPHRKNKNTCVDTYGYRERELQDALIVLTLSAGVSCPHVVYNSLGKSKVDGRLRYLGLFALLGSKADMEYIREAAIKPSLLGVIILRMRWQLMVGHIQAKPRDKDRRSKVLKKRGGINRI